VLSEDGKLYKNLYDLDQLPGQDSEGIETPLQMDWLHFNILRGADALRDSFLDEASEWQAKAHERHRQSLQSLKESLAGKAEEQMIPLIRPRGYDQLNELTLLIK
jgi:predicted Holliday junction resolvase-like endonuclease